MLINYHSVGANKLYSPIEDKLVISKDGLEDESKRWDWSQSSVRQESDTVTTLFEEDEQNEASTSQKEEVILRLVKLKERRSKKDSTRQNEEVIL